MAWLKMSLLPYLIENKTKTEKIQREIIAKEDQSLGQDTEPQNSEHYIY